MAKELRINDQIRAREVFLIDDQGVQIGPTNFLTALQMAQSKNLDLVEVAPTAVPPVCKMLDFGRFKYEQTKKERDAKKGQKALTIKEIWFRPNVGLHDRDTKTQLIRKFLEEGDKVKVTVRLRGRELAHPQRASMLLDDLAKELQPHPVERPIQAESRSRTMIVSPLKTLPKPAEPAPPVAAPAPVASGQRS